MITLSTARERSGNPNLYNCDTILYMTALERSRKPIISSTNCNYFTIKKDLTFLCELKI